MAAQQIPLNKDKIKPNDPSLGPLPQDAPKPIDKSIPAPPMHSASPDWLAKATAFLEANGWVELGRDEDGRATWDDPVGTREGGKKVDAIRSRTKGGGSEVIQQFRIQPGKWTYSTSEALTVQRQRDQWVKDCAAKAAAKELRDAETANKKPARVA